MAKNARKCAYCDEPIPSGKRSDAVYCSTQCSNSASNARRNSTSTGNGVALGDLVSRIGEMARRCANEEPSEKLRLMGTALVDMILLAIPNFASRLADGSVSASDMNTLAALALRLPDIRESLEKSANRMMPKMLHVKFVRPGEDCHHCGEKVEIKCSNCGVLLPT